MIARRRTSSGCVTAVDHIRHIDGWIRKSITGWALPRWLERDTKEVLVAIEYAYDCGGRPSKALTDIDPVRQHLNAAESLS